MTYPEFEESLDRFLVEASLAPGESLAEKLPAELRAEASGSPECARLLTEWCWLHEGVARCVRPTPGPDFANRIVASLKPPVQIAAKAPAATESWLSPSAALAYVSGLAAALMLAVVWNQSGDPAGLSGAQTVSVRPASRDVDLSGSIRDSGVAYLALVKNISKAVSISDDAAPATGPEIARADLSTPPVGKVIRGSTGNMTSAGETISTTIRPIADSAAGAFGFLWKSPSNGEKPST